MAINTNALENITATTTETSLVITPVDSCLKKSFFLINKGSNAVTFNIYGSATGIQSGDTPPNTSVPYTAAEINLHYILVVTININANDNHMVDLSDHIFNFFKLTVQTASGESIINYCFQKPYAMVG
jgi:hypothetical protein